MSEIQESPSKSGRRDDEVDLFELLQKLWAQKFIIISLTLLGLASAAGYAYLTPPKFESTTVLAPPSITAFAPFVQDIKVSSNSTVDLLGVALKLSDNVMILFNRRLLAPATHAAFILERPGFSSCTAVVSQNKSNLSKVTVSVTCADEVASLLALDEYIKYASEMTAKEFHALMMAVGVEGSIQASELYSVESLPSIKVTPMKALVLTLGVMFGGMLGVCVVLVRLVLEGRPSQAA